MTADAAQKRTQPAADCKAMVERAEQEVQQRWQAFDRKANELLDQYRSTDGLPSDEILDGAISGSLLSLPPSKWPQNVSVLRTRAATSGCCAVRSIFWWW